MTPAIGQTDAEGGALPEPCPMARWTIAWPRDPNPAGTLLLGKDSMRQSGHSTVSKDLILLVRPKQCERSVSPGEPLYSDPRSSLQPFVPFLSSTNTVVEIYGGSCDRLEKTEYVSRWPLVLPNLHVCTNRSDENCGKCLKCNLTMTTLAAVGKLSETDAFPS